MEWWSMTPTEVLKKLRTEERTGLSENEAQKRLETDGRNRTEKGEGKKGWTKRAPYDLPVDRQSFCGRTAEMTPVPAGHGPAFSRRRGSAREENGNTEQHDPAPSAGIQEQHDAGKAV